MKYTKKLLSLVLVLVLALALAVPGFAASITIDPNLPDGTVDGAETYTAYKIFDAVYAGAGTGSEASGTIDNSISGTQGNFGNISYTYTKTGQEDALYNAIVGFKSGDQNVFTLTPINNSDKYTVKVNEGVTYDAADLATALADVVSGGTTGNYNDDGNYVISGLAEGYYIIKSTLGSKMVVATLGEITINTKNDYPTLTKKIMDGSNPVDSITADYGDTITFKITVAIPATAKGAITVHDKLDGDMTYTGMTSVAGITVTDDPTDDCTKEFVLSEDYVDTNKGTSVSFEYTATLNGNVLTATAHPNTAYLTYAGYTSLDDTVNVYTYQLDVFKFTYDAEGEEIGLAGAGFVLKNENVGDNYGKYYKIDNNGVVTWVLSIDDATELSTTAAVGEVGEDGYQAAVYTVVFKGLANGNYTLIEKTVPTGYNPADDKSVTISGANRTGNDQIKVLNETGTVLPSTGGMGTTIFYTLGGVLVVGAAILLVTKKRVHDVEG